jgi:hypothetical protein
MQRGVVGGYIGSELIDADDTAVLPQSEPARIVGRVLPSRCPALRRKTGTDISLVMAADISMGSHYDASRRVSVRSKTLPASRAGMHRRYSIPTLLLPNALRLEPGPRRLVYNLIPNLREGCSPCSCQNGDGRAD